MKKLLVGAAVIAMGMSVNAPAQAQVNLDLSGHFKGYMTWHRQGDEYGVDERRFDILRETEVHFTGETTLDNGLTIGAHVELNVDLGDGDDNDALVDESYIYMSGMWGRTNFGAEDGAAYLLQVAAPSADSNIDGIRQFINPLNAGVMSVTPFETGMGLDITDLGSEGEFDEFVIEDLFGLTLGTGAGEFILDDPAATQAAFALAVEAAAEEFASHVQQFDYAQDFSGKSDKITYLTPVFEGFQAGVSYTPELGAPGEDPNSRAFGVSTRNTPGTYEHGWDAAVRWEGHFNQFGLTLGGGYSYARLQEAATLGTDVTVDIVDTDGAGADDATITVFEAADLRNYREWNLGGNVNFAAFNLGVVYKRSNQGIQQDADNRMWVVGGDYTTGPFKLGLSYADAKQELDFLLPVGEGDDLRTRRYSGGVTYTYGPGMTFRGSVHHTRHRADVLDNARATSLLVGTQINF